MNHLVEILTLKLIFQIMQQKQVLKIFHMLININNLNGKEIIGAFYEKEIQKTNQQEFRTEKVIKRNGDKLYVKWKGYFI